jgi:hypothetical protein
VVVVSSTKVTGKTPASAAGTPEEVRVTNPGNIWGALAEGWFADFTDVRSRTRSIRTSRQSSATA